MKTIVELARIRRLIWLYFFLLIFEGVLRKWVVPSLSNPLLLIRDPVVIAIYVYAFRLGIFPRNYFMLFGGWLSLLCLGAGIIAPQGSLSVALFGWRTDFLHLPLIFVLEKVWTLDDVKKVGRWTLLLSLPLAFLMVLQFGSGSNSWLNAGAGEGAGQIVSAMGHIRPAATFSFISGPVYFFALAAAFLFYSQLSHSKYPLWLVIMAMVALMVAIAVSGSRSLLSGVVIVTLLAFFSGTILQPVLVFRWIWVGCLMAVLALFIKDLSIMQDSIGVFTARMEGAAGGEGGMMGFLNRGLTDYTGLLPLLFDVPLLGYGLGVGTNVGSALLTGEARFLLAENEGPRVIMESGPILGGAFLILRLCLAGWLGWTAAERALKGNPLPLLLFGVCGLNIVNGLWGQATTLGFGAFVGGLCLASMRPGKADETHGMERRAPVGWLPRPDSPGSLRPEVSAQ